MMRLAKCNAIAIVNCMLPVFSVSCYNMSMSNNTRICPMRDMGDS